MGKIIAVANQKGGVGKTTTSINLSAALAYLKQKVLLVDFDPQGNASQGIGANKQEYDTTIYDVLLGDASIPDATLHLQLPPLDMVPARTDLAGADLQMAEYEKGREGFLKKKLDPIKNQYDYIIIDCPPSLGLLNTNALTAADSVLIPVQCEFYALEGLTQLLSTIRLVQRLFNPRLTIEGVLLTLSDSHTRLSIEVQQDVRRNFKEKVYKTIIPRNVRLAEAPGQECSIYEYDVKSLGAKAYVQLAVEVINAKEGKK